MKNKRVCTICKVEFDNFVDESHYAEDNNNDKQEERVKEHFCNYCSVCDSCAKKRS